MSFAGKAIRWYLFWGAYVWSLGFMLLGILYILGATYGFYFDLRERGFSLGSLFASLVLGAFAVPIFFLASWMGDAARSRDAKRTLLCFLTELGIVGLSVLFYAYVSPRG